jgi:prephenate dehydratase
MKVSIQGLAGSYHDSAAQAYFGKKYEPVCRSTFREVFLDVTRGHSDFALIALENSQFGSINQSYDLLLEHDQLWICGEIYLRVEHCLVGLKGATLPDLREVYSHPIALSQCEAFLDEELPYAERFTAHDTAGSAADVRQWNDPAKAAIASETAAKLYNLEIIKSGVETYHDNYTRFIILTTDKTIPKDASKTSFVIQRLGHDPDSDTKPGSLYHTLACFAEQHINLSKIESRPVIGKSWHYMFYLDFDCGLQQSGASKVLSCLEQRGAVFRVLGSYKPGKHIS